MRILVMDKYDNDSYYSVDAIVVGGETGVFAVWIDKKDLMHLASGDDGFWKEVAVYHKDWGSKIAGAIISVGETCGS